jgi:hypothetical protein
VIIDPPRLADLHDATVFKNGEAISEGQGLFLIMRHINRCNPNPPLNLTELDLHLTPEFTVQCGEWFVEEQDPRTSHESARQSHSLLLAARKLVGAPFIEPCQTHQVKSLGDTEGNFFMGDTSDFQPKCHIAEDRQVRKKRVTLKYHRNIPAVWRKRRHGPPV